MSHYLTAERLKELKQELDKLKNAKRPKVAKRLKRAKELGDLSENVEYTEAREEQQQVETRILELEEMVKNATIITKSADTDKVQLGSTIKVLKDGQEFQFTIVGSNEARPEAGLISNESPLGHAFFDKRVGDEVKVKTPSGKVTYKITNIE